MRDGSVKRSDEISKFTQLSVGGQILDLMSFHPDTIYKLKAALALDLD